MTIQILVTVRDAIPHETIPRAKKREEVIVRSTVDEEFVEIGWEGRLIVPGSPGISTGEDDFGAFVGMVGRLGHGCRVVRDGCILQGEDSIGRLELWNKRYGVQFVPHRSVPLSVPLGVRCNCVGFRSNGIEILCVC